MVGTTRIYKIRIFGLSIATSSGQREAGMAPEWHSRGTQSCNRLQELLHFGRHLEGGELMLLLRRTTITVVIVLIAYMLAPSAAFAQITTGNISGNVRDEQGGVIPSATVVLISETRATRSAPALTNETGDYVFPNV